MVGIVEAGVIAALVGVDAFAYAKYSGSEKKLKDATISSGTISKEEYDYLTGQAPITTTQAKPINAEIEEPEDFQITDKKTTEKNISQISFISPYAQSMTTSSDKDYEELESKISAQTIKIQNLQTKVNSLETEFGFIKEDSNRIDGIELSLKNLKEREYSIDDNHKFNQINESIDVVSQRLTSLEGKVTSIDDLMADFDFTNLIAKIKEIEKKSEENTEFAPETAVTMENETIDSIDFDEKVSQNDLMKTDNQTDEEVVEFHNQLKNDVDIDWNEKENSNVEALEDKSEKNKRNSTNFSQTVIFPTGSNNEQTGENMLEKLSSIETKLLEITNSKINETMEKQFEELNENMRQELFDESEKLSKKFIGLQKKESYKLSRKISHSAMKNSKELKRINLNLKKSVSATKLVAKLALKNSNEALRLAKRNNSILVETIQPEIKKIKEIALFANSTSKKLEKQSIERKTQKPKIKSVSSTKIKKTLTIRQASNTDNSKQLQVKQIKVIRAKPAKIKQDNVIVVKKKPKQIDESAMVSQIIESVEKEEKRT